MASGIAHLLACPPSVETFHLAGSFLPLPHSRVLKMFGGRGSDGQFLRGDRTSKSKLPSRFFKTVVAARSKALSGTELIAADFKVMKDYADHIKGWFAAWHTPLQPFYDPEVILGYFLRRPHLLLFRIIEVSAIFGSVMFQLEVEKLMVSKMKRLKDSEPESRLKGAELLKRALVRLGPTFIKVGQTLSTRPDLVGPDIAKVLAELQDSLPPFPTQQAITVIEEDLGHPVNRIFSYLSDEPVAAASFGQVYRGRTVYGQDVAVKVQRPYLLYSVARDICILRLLLAFIQKAAKRRSDLKLYADEIGQGLFGELDYKIEAANAIEFQAAHTKLHFLVVPNVIHHLSTERVLTMEWINGDRPKEMLLIAKGMVTDGHVFTEEERLKIKRRLFSLVNKGVEASLVQLLDTGILHADPHPGNMLYTPNGKMAFLDFGLLCRMEKHHQLAMLASVAHIVNADWKGLVKDLADMEVLRPDIDRSIIQMELEDALGDSVPKEGILDIKFSNVLGKILKIALRYQFKMPPYFILVLRSISSLEGLAIAVDPDFKVFASSYPYVVRRLLTDKSTRTREIFFSLILNERREFRWERLASFASLARQHSLKHAALEKGMELPSLNLSEYEAKETNPELVVQLASLLVSKDGAVFRQLVLEADTYALMRSFISNAAAPFRESAVKVIADVLYHWGKDFLGIWMSITLQDSVVSQGTGVAYCDAAQLSTQAGKALTYELMSLINADNRVDRDLSGNRHLQIFLRTLFERLRRKPLLMIKTVWTCLTVVFSAVALASHRLCVAISSRLFEPDSQALVNSQLSVS